MALLNRKEVVYVFLGVGKPVVVDRVACNISEWLDYVRSSEDERIVALENRFFVPRDNIRAVMLSNSRVEEDEVNLKLLFVFSGDNIALSSKIDPSQVEAIKTTLSQVYETDWALIQTQTDTLLIQTKHLTCILIQKAPQPSLSNITNSKPDISTSGVEQNV